ncbi:hypothetical protein M378DRAFT_160808, partial [Amanita muscaria Koide BX008]
DQGFTTLLHSLDFSYSFIGISNRRTAFQEAQSVNDHHGHWTFNPRKMKKLFEVQRFHCTSTSLTWKASRIPPLSTPTFHRMYEWTVVYKPGRLRV